MAEQIDYKNTLNLPRTDFPMKASLVNKEPEVNAFWHDVDIYEQIMAKKKDAPKYILHDGPPYANGNIHIGHALNKILKDIIIKYKTMKGFCVPYVPGWDCHGLPIEHQVTKKTKNIGQKTKLEVRDLCRQYAAKFVDIQKEEFERLGVFGAWDKPYLTMDYVYEANILEIFKVLVQNQYVEKRLKPIYWCSECRTALAEAEIEYQDHTSPSVYVKFDIKEGLDKFGLKNEASILIWTTTPWTLPANLAVAVREDFDYVFVEIQGKIIVLAEQLLKQVLDKREINDYSIKLRVKGKELQGLIYDHPFMPGTGKVILADFVTAEDGTGCVHIAPGHGEDDYRVGMHYGLDAFTPVNSKGEFTDDVPLFKGQKVFAANKNIIAKIDESGHLFYQENINHSYPHCWRCKKPVIFRATEQWFICVDKKDLRQKVLSFIKNVKWVPKWGETRITDMVAGRPDWCISRQRSWGVPIPVVSCKKCDKALLDTRIIDCVIERVYKEGCDVWFKEDNIHEFVPNDVVCECGSKEFQKENDILDVWFDSGVSHSSVLKARQDLEYPADLYLEGSDQHRGWFQSAIFTAVAAHDSLPYKTVLTHGFVVDGEGKKMSKSMGNVISPQEIIKKSGADIIRLWVASSDYSEDIRISDSILKQRIDAYRKIRNTCRFLLGNTHDFDVTKDTVEYKDMLEIDKWALSDLYSFLKSL